MSVVSNRDQIFGTSELRRGSTDRKFVLGINYSSTDTMAPKKSAYGSATGSSTHNQVALSDEASSSEELPVPRNNPYPVEGETSRWCVEGQ
uniref:Uncharacterized protein n=1 Tax=Solanum tuberosum TaxID=4113 RepID=M1D933_SOLTU